MAESPYPFKWYFRPETVPVVLVNVGDVGEELPTEQLASILAEIDIRHWGAIRQLLIETKRKAEFQLRNDAVIKDTQLSAHYQGWVNYADYVLANFEGLRSGQYFEEQQGGTPPQEQIESIR